ncbi:hypothetical protein [Rahnella sikkimica]|uniref:Uncharacterized protein n=1 Tax=Rahnella sikkimica TaxID=1805933 RepID=A0A2L1USC5_9GAMM|nr:hypothetical protein [Rahnella sikkimica]AVF35853.1 hypothetical protein BV494_13350 [Rahnella sikkimica]
MGKKFSSSAFGEFSRMPSTVFTEGDKGVKTFAACLAAMKDKRKRGWRTAVMSGRVVRQDEIDRREVVLPLKWNSGATA